MKYTICLILILGSIPSYAGFQRIDEWRGVNCQSDLRACGGSSGRIAAEFDRGYNAFLNFGSGFDDECKQWRRDPAMNEGIVNRLGTMEKSTQDSLNLMDRYAPQLQQELDKLGQDQNASEACKDQVEKTRQCFEQQKKQVEMIKPGLCNTATS